MNKKTVWNPQAILLSKILTRGGWVNAHAHFDRAYTLSSDNFHLANLPLQVKWKAVDLLKRESTVEQIYDRMAIATERMIDQGVKAVGTFIDVDSVIRDKAIKAATKLRERYQRQIKIKFINQVLKGVLTRAARKWFEEGAGFVDIIGGLPGRDKGHEGQHLDIVLNTARILKKMVHVHVDQLNSVEEKETELLVRKTIEHKMQGRVVAIHGISIAAHPQQYRKSLYQKMKQAGVAIISCPSAWIDSRRNEEVAPTHNSVTPIDELVPAGVLVALGTDNIADIYKPFSDGDMWTELRFLLESCHFYDINKLVEIASSNGLKVLGL